jgi:DNA repair protein RadC
VSHSPAPRTDSPLARRARMPVSRRLVECPRERLARNGSERLSTEDLVALVLRSGDRRCDAWTLARRLIDRAGGLVSLAGISLRELESIPGLGPAKAANLLAAFELGRRLASAPLERGQAIRSPADVQRHFQPRWRDRRRESFHALQLDGRHRLTSVDEVSVGTLTASLVHPREVFREAIRNAAAALLLVHHHPSGDPSPSPEDRSVTERLVAAGRLLGIRVVDHVIVADSGYFSFQEAGLIPDDEVG